MSSHLHFAVIYAVPMCTIYILLYFSDFLSFELLEDACGLSLVSEYPGEALLGSVWSLYDNAKV